MLGNKKLLLLAAMVFTLISLSAQTNSPYSRYGYGVLRDQVTGASKGMGGIGYGLRSNLSANPMNPASYSKVDSLTFLFDIGVSASNAHLSDGTNSANKMSGGLDYITMLMPLSKRLGLSFGLLPYSTVGYKTANVKEVSSTSSALVSYSGTGGYSQLYAGVGYSTPFKGLSVGANASYLFGTTEYIKQLAAITGTANLSRDAVEISLNRLKIDIGAQYELALSSDKALILGLTFSPGSNGKTDYFHTETNYDPQTGAGVIDTIPHDKIAADLPMTLGAGFTLVKSNKLTLGADVTYQNWSKVNYGGASDGLPDSQRFNDRWKFALGAEYANDPYSRNYLNKIKLRGGLNYGNSYLNVKTGDGAIKGYNEYGATLGFGFPLRDNESFGQRTSYLNINFEYKKIKAGAKNMIDEDYIGMSVNVNFNELWFFKKKIQ